MKKTLFLLIALVSLNSHAGVRNEMKRFALLQDRFFIDQDLKELRKNRSFVYFDMFISSGLRKIINDASDINDDKNLTQAQKDAQTLILLTKNVNTEKTVFVDVGAGAPLPYFKRKNVKFLPNLFFQLNAGANFTITNNDDPSNPVAQTYIKLDKKFGLASDVKWSNKETLNVALYYLIRSDLLADTTYQEISSDGKFVDLADLDKERKSFNADFSYKMDRDKQYYLFELKELMLYRPSSNGPRPAFKERPLAHFRYLKKYSTDNFRFEPFVGIHHRFHYSLIDGLYAGTHVYAQTGIPVGLTAKFSPDFMTVIPKLNFKHFHLSYTLKMAINNPQDDIWTPTIHSLAFSAPF